MRIEYRSEGGVAGQTRTCAVEADQLPPEAMDELMGLLALAQSSRSRSRPRTRAAGGADLVQYRITVRTAGKSVSLYFDEATLPAHSQALLRCLADRTRPTPLP